MEIMLNKKEKPAVDEMIIFIRSLTVSEQQELNTFMKGMKYEKWRTERGSA